MKIDAPPLLLGFIIILSFVAANTFSSVDLLYFPYRWIGLPIGLVGIGIAMWTRYTLISSDTTLDPKENPKKLVTSGPFKFSRNPFYLGYFIIALAVAVYLGNAITFLGPIAFILTLNTFVIPTEEYNLERTFNLSYLEYKKQVRRWI